MNPPWGRTPNTMPSRTSSLAKWTEHHMVRLYVGWNKWRKRAIRAIQASVIWGLSRKLICKGKLSSSKLSLHIKPLSCLNLKKVRQSMEVTSFKIPRKSDSERSHGNYGSYPIGKNDVVEMFLNGLNKFLERFVEEPGRQGYMKKSTGLGRVLLMEWCTLTSRLLDTVLTMI